MVEVFISVGSNIDPEENVKKAIRLLSSHVKILGVSTVYLTKPIGDASQPWYYNCVLKARTDIPPRDLKFKVLKAIEESMGRRRGRDKFSPRTIDLDILDYGGIPVKSRGLTLPDPDIVDRAYLASSLRELKPSLLREAVKMPREERCSRRDDGITPLKEYTKTLRELIDQLGAQESKTA